MAVCVCCWCSHAGVCSGRQGCTVSAFGDGSTPAGNISRGNFHFQGRSSSSPAGRKFCNWHLAHNFRKFGQPGRDLCHSHMVSLIALHPLSLSGDFHIRMIRLHFFLLFSCQVSYWYGMWEKWKHETDGEAADVEGAVPNKSEDHPLGHRGLKQCCMRVRQEKLCKEPELAFPCVWKNGCSLTPATLNQWPLKYSSSPLFTFASRSSHRLLSVLCALSRIQLCCCHQIQFCRL